MQKATPASFAQARIWLDEKIRFDPDKPQIAIYNMPFVYHLQPGHTLSIKQLRHALHLTVNKHPSLHTSLHFDIQQNLLMQRVITHEDKNNKNNMFSTIETAYKTDEQLNEILHDEKSNPHLFDHAQGLVFRCHIIYYKQISSNHLLSDKDILIFNFHHALFDFPSMKNIMGMFVSTLPYRIQLDRHCSFDELVKYVREKCLSILEHSHYPLQHILANLRINQLNISFLETIYDFITISSHSDELSLDGACFKQVSFEQSFEVAKFDFMLTFIYNPILENNRLSFRLACSHDLFNETTVTNIGRRLDYCFQQLFLSNETINRVDTCFTSLSKINLVLPEETQEAKDIIFCRQSHIRNEGMFN
ncbi:unnamed protein product [Adineta steineri]|uniref:Condensation domain-containing protein n=1 Tax=Adineta steineri TaxID=433720 RepID=A0A814VZ20_9BILA|nr:unnamed protein product [Adineta steineri]CAF1195213.1 unnamed protein product [Adineta steineri]